MKGLISMFVITKISAFFLTILLFLPSGHAFELNHIGLQHREFENGYVHNRAYFDISPIDTYIDTGTISLNDPNNESVPYDGTVFIPWRRLEYNSVTGEYNPNTGLFDYGPVTQNLYFNIDYDINPLTPKPLIAGDYEFNIEGEDHTASVNSVLDNLPFVDSGTLRKSYSFNPNYNENATTLYWSIPNLSGLDPNNISFRVECVLYNGTNWVSGFYITLPTDLNHVVIPDSVLNNQDLPEYTHIEVGIDVQTEDITHRTYSNYLNMDFITRIGDLDNDFDIEGSDLVSFAVAYASSSSIADIDGNGIVDSQDVEEFAKNFGYN